MKINNSLNIKILIFTYCITATIYNLNKAETTKKIEEKNEEYYSRIISNEIYKNPEFEKNFKNSKIELNSNPNNLNDLEKNLENLQKFEDTINKAKKTCSENINSLYKEELKKLKEEFDTYNKKFQKETNQKTTNYEENIGNFNKNNIDFKNNSYIKTISKIPDFKQNLAIEYFQNKAAEENNLENAKTKFLTNLDQEIYNKINSSKENYNQINNDISKNKLFILFATLINADNKKAANSNEIFNKESNTTNELKYRIYFIHTNSKNNNDIYPFLNFYQKEKSLHNNEVISNCNAKSCEVKFLNSGLEKLEAELNKLNNTPKPSKK